MSLSVLLAQHNDVIVLDIDAERVDRINNKQSTVADDEIDLFLAQKPQRSILVGDLNIAPREDDVWDHKKLLKVVSHTPIEVQHFRDVMAAGDWIDVTRQDIPHGSLYSWWSYRAKDWDTADKGRRLDHVWATADIAQSAHSSSVLRRVRGWDKPSDHAPVFASFDIQVPLGKTVCEAHI